VPEPLSGMSSWITVTHDVGRLLPSSVHPLPLRMMALLIVSVVVQEQTPAGIRTVSPSAEELMALETAAMLQFVAVRVAAWACDPKQQNNPTSIRIVQQRFTVTLSIRRFRTIPRSDAEPGASSLARSAPRVSSAQLIEKQSVIGAQIE